MNTLEKVCTDIQTKMHYQNQNCDLYGRHSNEFRVCQVELNAYLQAYEKCDFITNYQCEYEDVKSRDVIHLFKITLEMGLQIRVYITEHDIIYESV